MPSAMSSALLCPFLLLLLAIATLSSAQQQQRVNTTTATSSKASSSNRVLAKHQARSEYPHHGYEPHHFPHHFGGHHYGGLGHYKDLEHYLLPMLLVLGLGVLVMPMLGILTTSLVGNVPVTTLVSGRRRREAPAKPMPDEAVSDVWQKIRKALDAFSEDYKQA